MRTDYRHLVIALLCSGTVYAADGDSLGVSLETRLFVGEPHDVVRDDPYAFVGLDTGVQIFDLASGPAPIAIAHVYLPSPAYDLALFGDFIVVANGTSGIQVIDIADPFRPLVVGGLATFDARGVAMMGSMALVAETGDPPGASYGLRAVDLTIATTPITIGFVGLGNGAVDVAVSGSYAYVALGSKLSISNHGVAVVDVSSPAAMAQIDFIDVGEPVNQVVVVAGVAHIASGVPLAGSYLTADVTTPGSATVLSWQPLADVAVGVDVTADRAWLAAGGVGLLTFDVTDPAAPRLMAALATGRKAFAVDARGDVAFACERSTTEVGGFTTIATPPTGPMSEIDSVPYADAIDAAVAPSLALLLRTASLELFDTSTIGQPNLISRWAPPGANLSALDVAFPIAAVCQGDGVRLVDLTDPTAPRQRGVATVTTGVAVRPVIDGTVLWVVNGRGLDSFDISNPDSPTALGTYAANGWTAALAIDGPYGYLSAGQELQVLDLTSPAAPLRLARLPLGENLYGVAARGGLVVVGGETNYAHVIDVTTPSNPQQRSSLAGATGFDLSLYGTSVLVAAGEAGLAVVDLTDPSNPIRSAYFDTSGSLEALAHEGAYIYLASGTAQHWLVRCTSCPTPCATSVSIVGTTSVCEGTSLDLMALPQSTVGCSGGAFAYQWYEDGSPIPGATATTYTIPGTHPAGTPTFQIAAVCVSDSTCVANDNVLVTITAENWPTIAPNTLYAIRLGTDHELSWSINAGSGDTNIHRTLTKPALTLLDRDSLTLVGTTSGLTFRSNFDPGAFYRVFGRAGCSGASKAP